MIMKSEIKQRILVVSFSIIIVTHDREKLLSKCLDSIRPVHTNWQLVLVANGKELSQEILDKISSISTNVTILKTESQLTPGKARNLAIESCQNDWIYFLDDDAYILPGYWDTLAPLLEETKIDILGGPDNPASGMNFIGESLAIALSSPLCSGTTFSRHKSFGKKLIVANEENLTSCNLWIKRSALGGQKFPEDFLRAEETVLLQDLHSNGKKMFYHPKLMVGHHRRDKLRQIARPSFLAGLYRSKAMNMGAKTSNSIFWLPSVFVLLHSIYFLDPFIFWYFARMYVGLILFMSLAITSRERKWVLFPAVAFFHYFIVFLYGVGFLVGKIRKR